MGSTDPPSDGPPLERLRNVFRVYETQRDGDRLVYYGEPLVSHDRLLETAWPLFREHGYEVELTTETGEYVLVAEPADNSIDGIPWTNVILFVLTIVSTLYAGTAWYHIDLSSNPASVLQAWPFAAAVLGVLLTHELGHYVMTRYHGVDASLPYFVPVPTLIGTMGAVIRMKGQMPDREALFDIGVAGPLAGLAATIVVTAIGLSLPPEPVPAGLANNPNAIQVEFGYPPLLELIAWVLDQPMSYDSDQLAINPVVIGGWVGMFVTFLNLIPVGQLDGGHIVRAMVGEQQERIASFVPVVLFGLAAYVFYVEQVSNASILWAFWGLLATYVAYVGPANPIDDEGLDSRRKAVGVLTFVLGVLCFTPVPIEIIA